MMCGKGTFPTKVSHAMISGCKTERDEPRTRSEDQGWSIASFIVRKESRRSRSVTRHCLVLEALSFSYSIHALTYATTAFNSLDESRGGILPAMRSNVPRATPPEASLI